MDYREEAGLWISMEAGQTSSEDVAQAMGISHFEARRKYLYWLKAPLCPACGERCLNFVCPDCLQHNDMPWVCDACKAG